MKALTFGTESCIYVNRIWLVKKNIPGRAEKPNTTCIELGRRVAIARIAMQPKMSQVQAAVEVDISRGFLAGIESGKDTPSVHTLAKLATLYGVSMDSLVGRQSEIVEDLVTESGPDLQRRALWHSWTLLNDTQRHTITSAMEVMALANGANTTDG